MVQYSVCHFCSAMQLPADFDAQHFWVDSTYDAEAYTEPWPSDELMPAWRPTWATGYPPSTWP
jgi:hypothetical protein